MASSKTSDRDECNSPDLGDGGANPEDPHTESYQCFAHIPSQSLGPGSQESMLSSNLMPVESHSFHNIELGFANTSFESTIGGAYPDSLMRYSTILIC